MANCINIKGFVSKATPEQIEEAQKWSDENLHLSKPDTKRLIHIINSNAREEYFNGAVKLYSENEYSPLYHEAFHDFTQYHLDEKQREQLYKEAAESPLGQENTKGLTFDSDKEDALERMLAEDFLTYRNTRKAESGRVKRNVIFRKMLESLDATVGEKAPSLLTTFDKLGNLGFARLRVPKNSEFFGKLEKTLSGLSFKDSVNLYKAIDSMLAEQFRGKEGEERLSIARLFKVRKDFEQAYDDVRTELEDNLEYHTNKYNALVVKYNGLSESGKEQAYDELANTNRLLDNLEFTIDNWDKIRAKHVVESEFLKVGKYVVPEDFLDELEPETKDSMYNDKEEQSVRDKASDQLVYLLASLPKYQFVAGEPEPKANDFLDIADDLTDFDKAWNTLAKALTGERDYGKMWQKMEKLAKTNPEYHDLMRSLPAPGTPGNELSLLDMQLINQFIGTFSQPLVDRRIMNFWKGKEGELKVWAKPGISKSRDRLLEDWAGNIQEKQVDSKYRILDPETGQYSLDLDKIAEDFRNIGKSGRPRKEAFLEALGVTFSQTTKDSPEYKDLIENSPDIQKIYNAVEDLSELRRGVHSDQAALTKAQREDIAKPILDLPERFRKTLYGREQSYIEREGRVPRLVESLEDTLHLLADIELKYSEKYFSDNVMNSEGNSVYSIRQWSQQTVLFNLMNNPSFRTIEELIAHPLGAYFDKEKNPDADNIFLNALFNLETGKRRLDKNGRFVQITLYNHDGWNINTRQSEDEPGENLGSKTIKLERFEKLVQDISALLLSGHKEHIRYGDKTTSNGTEINFTRLTDSDSNQKHLPVDIRDFVDTHLPKEAQAIFTKILGSALRLTNDYFANGRGKNADNFKQNLSKGEIWGFFDAILSHDTKELLLAEGLTSGTYIEDIQAPIEKHLDAISKDLEDFLKKITDKTIAELKSNPVLKPEQYIAHDLLNKDAYGDTAEKRFETVMRAFSINSYILNAEHVRLMFQDPRFYELKEKGGAKHYDEIFKRIAKASSTGTMLVNNDQVNQFLNKGGHLERKQYNKEHPATPAPLEGSNGVTKVAIFEDILMTAEDFLEEIEKNFPEASKEELLAIRKGFSDMKTTDAAAFSTLDWYRDYMIRSGNDQWNDEKEELYGRIAKGEALSDSDKLKAFAFFPPIKTRFTGYVYDSESKSFLPFDLKQAIVPLIPQAVKGKAFEIIRDNMLRQNGSVGTYKTASKHSSITSNGKHNQLYNKDGSINTGNYVLNPAFVEYVYEVVSTPKEFKEESRYPTQRRKLMFSNSFEGGVPVDYRKEDWNSLTEEQKKAGSEIYRLEQAYGDYIDKLVNLEKDRLLKKLDAKVDEKGNFSINDDKLSNLLEREFRARNLPYNAYKSIEVVLGKFKFALDASLLRETIEQVLISIVDNRLRKQKTNGEGLVVGTSVGNEPSEFKGRVDSWKSINGNDLPFYQRGGRTLPGGTKVTSAMKVKIALQGDFKKLLKHPDVTKLAETDKSTPLEALNKLLKDETWLNSGIRPLISINGDKIPIQDINSMEFMEVYEFLPEEAGPIIIMPAAWVAKTGGDFDWDKNSARFPRISNKFTLYKVTSEATKVALLKERKHLSNKLKSTLAKLEEKDIIARNLSDEIEIYAYNLFSEDDDLVIEAKKGMDRIIRSMEKSEQQEVELRERISELTDLAEEMNDKAAYQNEIAQIERRVLERDDLYNQLVTPNSTYMFEPTANARKEALEKEEKYKSYYVPASYGLIPSVTKSLDQFQSNTVGRQSLGIGAVFRTFFAQLQKAGVVLNDEFLNNPDNPKGIRYVNIRLPHNKIKGKTSVSGIYSRRFGGSKYRISDVISQLMNGWVDVAKKDWVFYINGVKEVAPKMLYAAMTGIHKDILMGFFNQPVITDYLKNLANYKSDIVKMQEPELFKTAKLRAIIDTLEKYLPGDVVIETKNKRNPVVNAIETLKAELEASKTNKDHAAFAYGHIYHGLRILANKNEELFEPRKFMKFAIPDKKGNLAKPESREEKLAQALYLIQYIELEMQQNVMDAARRTINQDTAKPESLYISGKRSVDRHELETYHLIPQEFINKMANEGSIRAFTHSKTGIDAFLHNLTNQTFEITNHPVFKGFLFNEFNKKFELGNIPFDKKWEIRDDWVKAVKNDLILYLYENYVYKIGTNVPVVEYIKDLMKYDTALALDLEAIKRNNPDLVKNNLLLDMLIRDNSTKKLGGKPKLVSLKLKKARLETTTSNVITEAFEELYNHPNPELSQFARKLGHFAFIQSGLTKSDISFANVIPQEVYGEDMTNIIGAFKDLLDKDPLKAKEELTAFYKMFKKNNRKFFSAQTFTEEDTGAQVKDINFAEETKRFKNYTNPDAIDLLEKKLNIRGLEREAALLGIKQKTFQDTEEWDSSTAKNNPKNFYLYETNESNGGKLASAVVKGDGKTPAPNTAPIITSKKAITSGYWRDDTYDSNIARIDQSIEDAVKAILEANPDKVLIPKNLFEVSHLDETAPKTAAYLAMKLKENFGFEAPVQKEKISLTEEKPVAKPVAKAKRKTLEDKDFEKPGTDEGCPIE